MLTDKIVLLTGASRGIGRAVAMALASQGATLILLSRNLHDLNTLAQAISDAGHPEPILYPFNLCNANPTDYDDLRLHIKENYGRLDGLICNAGILGALTPLEYYDLQTWYQVLQVNLNSVFLLTQASIPLLKCAKRGSILLTVADVATQAKANWGAYAIASNGCLTMMHMLASELENISNIRVNAIQPQRVNTLLRSAAYPAESRDSLCLPTDVAYHYVQLMSDSSAHIRGQVIKAYDHITT